MRAFRGRRRRERFHLSYSVVRCRPYGLQCSQIRPRQAESKYPPESVTRPGVSRNRHVRPLMNPCSNPVTCSAILLTGKAAPLFSPPTITTRLRPPSAPSRGRQTRTADLTRLPPRPQDQADGALRAEASRGRPQAGGQPQRAAPHRPDPPTGPKCAKPTISQRRESRAHQHAPPQPAARLAAVPSGGPRTAAPGESAPKARRPRACAAGRRG